MIVLGTLALYAYPRASARALPLMWLGAGLGTWLIGRDSVHFGASGVAHGLMFFLFVLGALRWDRRAIAVALVANAASFAVGRLLDWIGWEVLA